jgi:hypothetical protein
MQFSTDSFQAETEAFGMPHGGLETEATILFSAVTFVTLW